MSKTEPGLSAISQLFSVIAAQAATSNTQTLKVPFRDSKLDWESIRMIVQAAIKATAYRQSHKFYQTLEPFDKGAGVLPKSFLFIVLSSLNGIHSAVRLA